MGKKRGEMKLKLKVTGASKLTDNKLLVQLQGKFGNAVLRRNFWTLN